MSRTKSSPPLTQRLFANPWSELDYLCRKIHFWLHTRSMRARALLFLPRLERVLSSLPESNKAILRAEGLSLWHELRGDLNASILHRQREIQLMQQLQQEAQSSRYDAATRAYMLRGRDTAALRERRRVLDSLLKQGAASNGAQLRPVRSGDGPPSRPRAVKALTASAVTRTSAKGKG